MFVKVSRKEVKLSWVLMGDRWKYVHSVGACVGLYVYLHSQN